MRFVGPFWRMEIETCAVVEGVGRISYVVHSVHLNIAMVKNPSKIGNKAKRAAVYAKYKQQKSKIKKIAKQERIKEAEALGDEVQKKVLVHNVNVREILLILSRYLERLKTREY